MKQKKYILFLSLFLSQLLTDAQDLSGRWVGVQTDGIKISFDLVHIKDSISGICDIEFPEERGKATVYLEGTFRDGVFKYESKKFLERNVDSIAILCFVKGTDFLKIKKHKYILEGTCINIDEKEECLNLSCIERYEKKVSFSFSKTDFIGRKVLVVDTIVAMQDTLELAIWDNLKEDGDIVSVYMNEEKIISEYLLKHEHKIMKVVCKKDLNDIIFFAHNLGSEPPNTATIAVYQNGKLLKQLDIKSDANKSESFVIKRQ